MPSPFFGKTLRFGLRWLEGKSVGSDIDAGFKALADDIEQVDQGHADYLQAGVVDSTDWSFIASINGGTGVLASTGATGGTAWLPDPIISGALMRSITPSAVLAGLKVPVSGELPTSGKYTRTTFELTPSEWGGTAIVSVRSLGERSSQAEAEAISVGAQAGKIKIRDVIVKNTAGAYSIVAQFDARIYATQIIGDTQVVEGRALVGTEDKYASQVTRVYGTKYLPNATRRTEVSLTVEKISEEGKLGMQIFVGGTVIAFPWLTKAAVGDTLTHSFTCNPGEEWEVRAGVGETATIRSSYREL
jgi:hypothetical protein